MKLTRKNQQGFTIIELSLSLIFVSILFLAISFLVLFIKSVYQKGTATKVINSVGRTITKELQGTIGNSNLGTAKQLCASKYLVQNNFFSSEIYKKCVKDNALKFSYQQHYDTVKIAGVEKTVPTHGVFCSGTFTYLWNTGYVLNPKDYYWDGPVPKGNFNGNSDYKLLKIPDADREICKNNLEKTDYHYLNGNNDYTMHDTPSVMTEIITNTDNEVALYDLVIFPPNVHDFTIHALFSGTFILGTLRGEVDITLDGDYCKSPPGNLSTDFNYCALNKFNFATRASGESSI